MSDVPPPPGAPPPPPGGQPQVVYVQQQKKKGGCLKFGAIGAAILVLLIIIAAIASGGGEDDDPGSGSNTTEAPGDTEPEVDAGIGSSDATEDVAISRCGLDEFGYAEAELTVTNNSSEPSDYFIEVAFESADGSTRIGEGNAVVTALASGQSATEVAGGFEEGPEGMTCRLLTVQRTAS
jgi:hypothetical protein